MKIFSNKVVKLGIMAMALIFALFGAIGCGSDDTQATNANGEKVDKLTVSFQPTYDAWAGYDAIKTGFDKENGIAMDMMFFDSGMPQIEAVPAKQYDIGVTGAVPSLFAALRFGCYVVAVGDDESWCNTVMVRPDSPLLETQGYNPKYPDVYGSPDDLKGKDIFVTTVSSGHYALASYLKAIGLTEDDVNILNMEQAQMVSAFESGKGDAIAVWAPFSYTGLKKGWKDVGIGAQVGAINPMIVIVPKKFGDEHPELVAKFLKTYLTREAELKANEANLVSDYQEFQKDWSAIDLDEEFAKMDMEKHLVFNIDEQLKMFDNANGRSEVEETLAGIINFFAEQGKFTAEERDELLKFEYVTDKFLKLAAEQQ